MNEPLEVCLDDIVVATAHTVRGKLRMRFTEAALDRFELNTPVLSVAMPVSAREYTHRVVHPFFDGLLPEGEQRGMLAHDFGLSELDTFGLLGLLGRDCAGALVVYPSGSPPAQGDEIASARAIDDDDVARRLRELRSNPLGVDGEVRVSLAGLQGKLLLTWLGDRWGLPVNGAPSTHILKPAGLLRGMVANEAFCLALAQACGVESAKADVTVIDDRPVLVVERFDRRRDGGRVERVHQEDFCQALSLATRNKYEESRGPSLAKVAKVLRDWRAPASDLDALLKMVTFSVTVGNADLHGKNVGLLHGTGGDAGGVCLAPAYDIMSTLLYEGVSRTAGMFVNGVQDLRTVTARDLVAEATGWGVARHLAQEVVIGVIEGVREHATAVAEVWGPLPTGLEELVVERAEKLLSDR